MKIIGGTAKGRIIKAPEGRNTRPTSGMVREAVFAMLGEKTQGAKCLDLFCGSGAMAFEAISRGARAAVLVDADPKAVAVARANARTLGFDCEIYRNDALRALQILAKKNACFDIVFLDPPYAEGWYAKALDGLRGVVDKQSVIVCEHDAKQQIEQAGYSNIKTARYGTKAVTLLAGG